MRDLEGFLEDIGGFVLHEKQVAVRFVLADFLHDAQEVDAREEVSPRELGDGLRWWLGGGVAELIDFWTIALSCVLPFLESQSGQFVFCLSYG